ncbi:MAG: hypothetical protein P4K86_00055 [Terracidiphilus sp.]|nr:hypothetical protein [Terracidiphilus sp.]
MKALLICLYISLLTIYIDTHIDSQVGVHLCAVARATCLEEQMNRNVAAVNGGIGDFPAERHNAN